MLRIDSRAFSLSLQFLVSIVIAATLLIGGFVLFSKIHVATQDISFELSAEKIAQMEDMMKREGKHFELFDASLTYDPDKPLVFRLGIKNIEEDANFFLLVTGEEVNLSYISTSTFVEQNGYFFWLVSATPNLYSQASARTVNFYICKEDPAENDVICGQGNARYPAPERFLQGRVLISENHLRLADQQEETYAQ
ncbi:MAG: hypothetical protein H6502_05430 [Candidatus Woesearchaeota archaeon]|nr:MAG: hypothetical protein H6502_05430 [Candidatus Woesearchaeota archaeon]